MGDQRSDLAREFLERLAAIDADRATSLVAEDYEGSAVAELPMSGEKRIYRGREGLRAWIDETIRGLGAYKVERLRFRDYGDALLVIGANRTGGQMSPFGSAEHRWTFVCVFRFEGELISSVHAYTRYEDAIDGEGLSEPADER